MLHEDLDLISVANLKKDHKRIQELVDEMNQLYKKYMYPHESIDGTVFRSMKSVIEETLGRKVLNDSEEVNPMLLQDKKN